MLGQEELDAPVIATVMGHVLAVHEGLDPDSELAVEIFANFAAGLQLGLQIARYQPDAVTDLLYRLQRASAARMDVPMEDYGRRDALEARAFVHAVQQVVRNG